MGKVVYIDKGLQEVFEKLEKLRHSKIHSLCVVVTRDDGVEDFFFSGAPPVIYQSLALAMGYVLQSYSLMDDVCSECMEGEEED